MKLFVFEGCDREPQVWSSLTSLYFTKERGEIVHVPNYGEFHDLYKRIRESDESLFYVLKKKLIEHDNHDLDKYREDSFSQIYLFFDYDFHTKNISLDQLNSEFQEMLEYFNDETKHGKLFIHYPMLEAIRHTQKLPDKSYCTYEIARGICGKYKDWVNDFSCYKSHDFLSVGRNNRFLGRVYINWGHLVWQNVMKANFLCNGILDFPACIEDITPKKIFNVQIAKFVSQNPPLVSVLSAFPIFLYDYFGKEKWI